MEIDFDLLFRFVIAVDILLCVAIIVCNLILLFSILCWKRARTRTRNVMLVSVCLADLLVGAFTHPIYIHSYHTGTLFHSCEMHILMQLIGDYSQDFVCFWTLVTLGTIYLYRVAGDRWGWGRTSLGQYGRLSPPSSRCHSFVRLSKKALVVGWPWLGTLLIPIPILMATVDQSTRETFWDETFCPLHTPFPSRMVVLVIVFYLPIATLLLLCVGLALIMYWDVAHRKTTLSTASSTAGSASEMGCQEATAITASINEDREGGRVNGHLEGKVIFREASANMLDHAEPVSEDPACASIARDGDANRDTTPRAVAVGQPSQRAIMHTQDLDPNVTLVTGGGGGRRGGRGADTDNADPLDHPSHILAPLLITVVCALPLMVGWWFYREMDRETVIIVSVVLSRVYLLRAAILPLAWLAVPELRQACIRLWACLCNRRSDITGRETGEFSVAYTTLTESCDAPTSACQEGRERRHNPFHPDFVQA